MLDDKTANSINWPSKLALQMLDLRYLIKKYFTVGWCDYWCLQFARSCRRERECHDVNDVLEILYRLSRVLGFIMKRKNLIRCGDELFFSTNHVNDKKNNCLSLSGNYFGIKSICVNRYTVEVFFFPIDVKNFKLFDKWWNIW